MIDEKTGVKTKSELRDLKVDEVSFVDRPAIRENYAFTKREEGETEVPPVEGEPVVEVAKEDKPPEAAAVATPAHDALLSEKIAVIEKQLADLIVMLKAGTEMYEVWGKLWDAQDLMCSLWPETMVIGLAKRDSAGGAAELTKAIDEIGTVLKAEQSKRVEKQVAEDAKVENTGAPRVKKFTSESIAEFVGAVTIVAKVFNEVGADGVAALLDIAKKSTDEPKPAEEQVAEAVSTQKADFEAQRADLQKKLDDEIVKTTELAKKLEQFEQTATSKALETEEPVSTQKAAGGLWGSLVSVRR